MLREFLKNYTFFFVFYISSGKCSDEYPNVAFPLIRVYSFTLIPCLCLYCSASFEALYLLIFFGRFNILSLHFSFCHGCFTFDDFSVFISGLPSATSFLYILSQCFTCPFSILTACSTCPSLSPPSLSKNSVLTRWSSTSGRRISFSGSEK